MDSNFQVKITADLGDLVAKIKNIETTLAKLDGSFKGMSAKATDSFRQTGQAAAVAGLDMNRMRLASFALGQVIRDSGFFAQSFGLGLLAISNNIPILIDQLVLLSNVSKGLGIALSMMGSILTAALTIFAYASMSADKYDASLDKIRATAESSVITLNSLLSIARDLTLSDNARQQAIDKLNQDYDVFNENLTIQTVNSEKTKAAVDALTKSIYLQAEAQILQNEIQDELEKRRKLEKSDLKDNAKWYQSTTNGILIGLAKMKAAALLVTNPFSNATKGLTSNLASLELQLEKKGLANRNSEMQKSDDIVNELTKAIKDNLLAQAELNLLAEKDKGKGKESEQAKSVKRISDAYKELGNTLAFLSADPTITQLERLKKSSEAYKSLLETLFKEGFKESSKEVQNIIAQLKIFGYEIQGIITTAEGLEKVNNHIKSFADIMSKLAESKIDLDTGSFGKSSQKINQEIELVADAINKLQKLDAEFPGLANIGDTVEKLKSQLAGLRVAFGEAVDTEKTAADLKKFKADFTNFTDNFNAQVINFLATGVSDFAFAIGQMFVTGDMGSFGIEILSSVADFLKSLGSQMVQFGMMAVLFGKLQLALMLGDPVTKISAGLALIGVGVAMSIAAGAISAGIKKGQDKKKAKPFAKGGIVSSPTNALIGEYPGARRNPEVVAPLDKLKSLIGDSGSGGGMFSGQLETRVSGNDLVILINRASKNRNGYY